MCHNTGQVPSTPTASPITTHTEKYGRACKLSLITVTTLATCTYSICLLQDKIDKHGTVESHCKI